jgi:hypothetical protein
VNQLVRTQKRDVADLFKAGDALQKAQADLLAGRAKPDSLRQAVETERTARDRLVAKARGLLSSEGHELTPARLEQVSETLHAATLDEEARAEVQGGRLIRELRHAGLGTLGVDDVPESPPRRRAQRRERDDRADERAAELKAARQAEAAARRQAEGAARKVKAAEQQRDRAAEALDKAEAEVATARAAAEGSAGELREAQQTLRRLKPAAG